MKIKKGDKVEVISGNAAGRQGVVERVLPRLRKVVISGVNVVKKHVRQKSQQKPGGIISIAKPFDVSKVMLVCPSCKAKTRVGYRIKRKEKFRVCKKCKAIIE
ncbi:50S ribosomal protein L24 [candidate division CPR3 bacterium 4484_211]|uniref:Large ribosomal subunit protein uL24 n=1 Tax=candidate division CPR3 bacterium 4484_211 TaxID=1968527 RepID=A0A1W9NZQ7_UNCC3|nr:MAG: 50S ribosomal protein L24 [candidate division CPR3 bacterium 4484_211]